MEKARKAPLTAATRAECSLERTCHGKWSGCQRKHADEYSWVMVKKQRVAIWIPPLSSMNSPNCCSVSEEQANLSPTDLLIELESKNSRCIENSRGTTNLGQVIDNTKASKDNSLACPSRQYGLHLPLKIVKPTKIYDCFEESLHLPSSKNVARKNQRCSGPVDSAMFCTQNQHGENELIVSVDQLSGSEHHPWNKQERIHLSALKSCMRVGEQQNQHIRLLNLASKLEKAGGLSRWLLAIGLDQFLPMLQRENIDSQQLLGLTMGNLKDMGVDAVGPRRKLIHAIDELCRPYYF